MTFPHQHKGLKHSGRFISRLDGTGIDLDFAAPNLKGLFSIISKAAAWLRICDIVLSIYLLTIANFNFLFIAANGYLLCALRRKDSAPSALTCILRKQTDLAKKAVT